MGKQDIGPLPHHSWPPRVGFRCERRGEGRNQTMDFPMDFPMDWENPMDFPMDLAFLLWGKFSLWILPTQLWFSCEEKCPRSFWQSEILMGFWWISLEVFISLKSSSHNCTLSRGTRCLSASCPSHKTSHGKQWRMTFLAGEKKLKHEFWLDIPFSTACRWWDQSRFFFISDT